LFTRIKFDSEKKNKHLTNLTKLYTKWKKYRHTMTAKYYRTAVLAVSACAETTLTVI